MDGHHIECHDFATASEFLHALLPTSNVWSSQKLERHIFRGHADATWPLIPTAMRSLETNNYRQRAKEIEALSSFWLEADRQGLPVPGDCDKVRRLWIGPAARGVVGRETLALAGRGDWAEELGIWPPPDIWQGLALAQHYAAQEAAEKLGAPGAPSRMAVWACHENILLMTPWLEPSDQRVHLVVVPRSGNPNLHAQHGVFTLVISAGMGHELPDQDVVACLRFDEVIGLVYQACKAADSNMFVTLTAAAGPPLRKLTLPCSEAPMLLEFLDALGVSGATMKPGFGGAADGAKERALRKRLKDGK
jgi:hypothetical protein